MLNKGHEYRITSVIFSKENQYINGMWPLSVTGRSGGRKFQLLFNISEDLYNDKEALDVCIELKVCDFLDQRGST